MPSAQTQDPNGFLEVKGCPVSSFGIFEYSAGQLELPGDPNRIVKVFRPESAVNDPEAIASFQNKPFIINHTMLSGTEDADVEGEAPEDVGVDGVMTNVRYQAPWMRGDIHVFSRKARRIIGHGTKDLSLGYNCKFDMTPGVWNGQEYEAIQHSLRGNHIALVPEGRVPGAKVLDGRCFDHLSFEVLPSNKDTPMPTQNAKPVRRVSKSTMDNAVQQLKQLLPALEQYLNEEAGEPAHQTGAVPAGEATTTPPAAVEAVPAAGVEQEQDTMGAEAPSGGGEGGDLSGLIAEVEAVLAKLKAATAGGQEAENAAPQTGDNEAPPMGEEVGDNVEGLQEQEGGEGAAKGAIDTAATSGGQGSTSPGPAAGKHTSAEDAALGRFYDDLARKNRLYDRLSKVVGAFDSSSMDARAVAVYGADKLKLKVTKGQEAVALDAYLTGVEGARNATKTIVAARSTTKPVGDAANGLTEIEAYLNGAKS